ncbi:MAG: hypothetical protein JEZ06_08010 [Anaerolineaceae bacterium]|nr:hypothetical protein [Anaerolineaceae bacterium]
MSKRSYIKPKVVRIRNVVFRLSIVLSMVFLSLAIQATSVYAYSSNEEILKEIKQIVLLESIGDRLDVTGTKHISADDLGYASGENTGAPENGYSKHTLVGVYVPSGGHVLAKMALEPHAYNGSIVVQINDTDGTPKSGVNVYAFSGTTYSGVSGISNAYGTATLTLPDGNYRFRADLNGTQFWSGAANTCSIPTCTTDVVTVSKPVSVTVVDTDGTPKAGLSVYAFDGTTYSGYSKVSDAYGVATFTLPLGDYHFRADLLGTHFWSAETNDCTLPGCESAQVTVSKPVTVIVMDTDGPISGLNVYAFNGTTYSGYNKVSNAYGVATFILPLGDYRFRADLNGTQFWSAETNHCTLPGCENAQVRVSKPITVTVVDTDGTPKSGLNVYAFDGNTYAGYSKVTDATGIATFTLPLGDYRFRADLNGTRFWSADTNHCTLPGCESAQVTVSKPVTVTVLDTGDTPKAGLNVYAFDGTTYKGYSKVTDVTGVATFTLPLGDYRFRADFNGTQFWSDSINHCTIPDCTDVSVIVTQPVTVTVLDTNGAPQYGLKVYAFDGTVYKNYSKTTNLNGEAVFTLPQGDYHFRADLNGTQFWSSTGNDCSLPGCSTSTVTVTIPVQVVVQDNLGGAIVDVPVYAFNGTTYANFSKRTNEEGVAAFTLPQGDYRFRIDVDGEQIWSSEVNHCTIPGCELVPVVVEGEATLTPTLTDTITNTPTTTRTMTITSTRTNTRTFTPSATRTRTPTQTMTRTPTRTSTQTFTNTPSRTYTPTRTPTRTITRTPTETSTQTFTRTPTLSATITQTPTNTSTAASCAGSGSILREHWDGISGGLVDDLLSASAYPDNPDSFTYETNMYYTGGGDSFGERWRGYLCPPFDGEYTIYLASDNQAKVYLSSDASPANMNLIAYIPDDVNSYNPYVSEDTDFYDYPEQSSTLNLVGGELYYIEAYWKENTGGQHFNVAWTMPNYPGGPYTIYRDSLVPITPEPTYTPTSTQTPTPTITPTPTATATQTSTLTPTLTPTQASCAGTGSILRQSWDNISSASISALQNDPRYPYFPDGEEYLLSYKGPINYGDYYGARYRGYICAPYDDWYRFYVSSDDDSELYLSNSTDPAGMSKIAYVSDWTSNEEWDKYSSQRSEWIYLNAGQEYYTESYHVEYVGGDHFTVGWEGLNYLSGDIQVIDNDYLRPYIPEDIPVPTPQTCTNAGSILRQHWDGISGGLVDDLLAASAYPNNADYFTYETDMYTTGSGDYFGERWRGYLCPPFDGEYTIYMASNNQAKVYLSSDASPANMNLVAYLPDSDHSYNPYVSGDTNFYVYPEQSTTLNLMGGTLYYIEAYWKENTAGQFINVAWTMPYYSGGPYTIAGEYLVPVTPEPTYTPTVTQTPTITLTPTITDTPTTTYTATSTYTPSDTPTITNTPTITYTPSNTSTRTLTQTPTQTGTRTPTSSATITKTPTSTSTEASCAGTGSINRQYWDNISSASISALQTDPRFPNLPDVEDYPLTYKGPVNYGDNYGERYQGYICAPYTDYYRFYVSSDQDSELYLSTSTNPAGMSKIAYVDGWTDEEDWDQYLSQRSAWIFLNAGQEYYTESYHVEGEGPDNFTVGWEGRDHFSGTIQVIDENYLRPYIPQFIPTPQTCANTGSILRERWNGVSGGLVDELLAASAYPNNPDYFIYETDMYTNSGGDYFGDRWRGYLCPPFDGEYTIYMASNNQGKVYLSSDANPANLSLIAYLPDSDHDYNPYVSGIADFYNYPEQSTTLNLMGGTLYYIEAYWKESDDIQFFNVAWTMPQYSGGPYTIQGQYLVPVTPEPAYTPTITLTPTTTYTATRTYTPSRTYTPTTTYTPTITRTPTLTFTPTKTFTPSFTETVFWTMDYADTTTPTPTSTITPSGGG